MAEITPPAWLQAGTYSARTDRLSVINATMCGPGRSFSDALPLAARTGVRPSYQSGQLLVKAAATPNMTVTVTAGFAIIENRDVNGYGAYVVVNDADKILSIDPAGTTGQYRKDVVVASVYDAETAGTVNEARIEVIKGTYASSAAAAPTPTLPPNSTYLADIAIGPGQTSISNSNITGRRTYTVGLGGILPVVSSADLDRPHPGQVRYLYDLDKFRVGRNDGTSRDLREGVSAVQTMQSAAPPYTPTGSYVDFTSSAWAPITVTVPPSGQVKVTIGGEVYNTATSASTATMAWRASGAATISPSNYNYLISHAGIRFAASRSRLLDSLTPGASLTITPQWRISSGDSATAGISGGVLIVEPVA